MAEPDSRDTCRCKIRADVVGADQVDSLQTSSEESTLILPPNEIWICSECQKAHVSEEQQLWSQKRLYGPDQGTAYVGRRTGRQLSVQGTRQGSPFLVRLAQPDA